MNGPESVPPQLLNVLEQLSLSLENALHQIYVEPYMPAVTKEQIGVTQKCQARLNNVVDSTLGAVKKEVIAAVEEEVRKIWECVNSVFCQLR